MVALIRKGKPTLSELKWIEHVNKKWRLFLSIQYNWNSHNSQTSKRKKKRMISSYMYFISFMILILANWGSWSHRIQKDFATLLTRSMMESRKEVYKNRTKKEVDEAALPNNQDLCHECGCLVLRHRVHHRVVSLGRTRRRDGWPFGEEAEYLPSKSKTSLVFSQIELIRLLLMSLLHVHVNSLIMIHQSLPLPCSRARTNQQKNQKENRKVFRSRTGRRTSTRRRSHWR